jgi:transmembrane sensor
MIEDSTPLKEAARWFAVIRRNVMSMDERQSFEQWMTDPDNRAALAQMERSWDIAGQLTPDAAGPARAEPAVRVSRRTAMGVAGGLAASLAVGFVAADKSGLLSRLGWDGEVETGIGEQREITLPEGSVIHLNVLSRVRWRLTDSERTVSLDQGDALFTVSRNPDRPFAVRSTAGTVRVLGTVFSVSLRDQSGGIAVREGHVAFAPHGAGADPVQIAAGQGVRFGPRGIGKVAAVAPDQVGEWCDHFVTFDQAELGDVARELGRYFPVKLRLEPAEAAKRRVTLRLKLRDQSSTLDVLSQLLDAHIERQSGRRIVLRLPS